MPSRQPGTQGSGQGNDKTTSYVNVSKEGLDQTRQLGWLCLKQNDWNYWWVLNRTSRFRLGVWGKGVHTWIMFCSRVRDLQEQDGAMWECPKCVKVLLGVEPLYTRPFHILWKGDLAAVNVFKFLVRKMYPHSLSFHVEWLQPIFLKVKEFRALTIFGPCS